VLGQVLCFDQLHVAQACDCIATNFQQSDSIPCFFFVFFFWERLGYSCRVTQFKLIGAVRLSDDSYSSRCGKYHGWTEPSQHQAKSEKDDPAPSWHQKHHMEFCQQRRASLRQRYDTEINKEPDKFLLLDVLGQANQTTNSRLRRGNLPDPEKGFPHLELRWTHSFVAGTQMTAPRLFRGLAESKGTVKRAGNREACYLVGQSQGGWWGTSKVD
jgi:hypothetical protein